MSDPTYNNLNGELLPSYSLQYNNSALPSYPSQIKSFTIHSNFSLIKKIPQCKWKLQEAGTKASWFSIKPTNNGIQLIDFDDSVIMKTHQLPRLDHKLYFKVIDPLNQRCYAEVISQLNQCVILMSHSYQKETEIKKYVIEKKRLSSGRSIWNIYLNGFPDTVVCSFNLKHDRTEIADVRFNCSYLTSLEFYTFFSVVGQLVSLIYS
ncbi:hypothetical protein K502DRAFT_347836 [Neoconidiobolus thromboides FSU 785]|nr:hypothetical protein K502DRAFT_347836 [Neoconidiobolus thromboides FSU 785]